MKRAGPLRSRLNDLVATPEQLGTSILEVHFWFWQPLFQEKRRQMDKYRATSWTGSERERREQGVCLPSQAVAKKRPKYTVPAGCPCAIQKVMGGPWRPHRTTMETGYERYEFYQDKHYTFRRMGWFIKIHRRYVMHREDSD